MGCTGCVLCDNPIGQVTVGWCWREQRATGTAPGRLRAAAWLGAGGVSGAHLASALGLGLCDAAAPLVQRGRVALGHVNAGLQGLTIGHFSAQLEHRLSQENTLYTLDTH